MGALDLINRQKAEIERLKTDNALLRQDSNADTAEIRALRRKLETSKYEAIKEFAEKLKSYMSNLEANSPNKAYKTAMEDMLSYYVPKIIDDVVKEMTEG